MTDAGMVILLGLAAAALVTAPSLLRVRRVDAATAEADRDARRLGLREPASLHPVIDTDRCIGVGSCMRACPEERVIGMRNGQAYVTMPGRCVGHGACERACPVGAIRLVFGTSERGVDLPLVSEDFETNVPGLFVVGELGGMGLIKNAFEQGRQCIERIVARRDRVEHGLDLVIVGCGPAGLSATLAAHRAGLKAVTLEREDVGGSILHYPRKKLVVTEPFVVPGFGRLSGGQTKEELVELWTRTLADEGLNIHSRESVTAIERADDGWFRVVSDQDSYVARRVVLAIGRRGKPQTLDVPGERLTKVHYSLRESETFRGDKVLVVGGGDAAIEAALDLADQPGTAVTLCHRRRELSGVTSENALRLRDAVGGGQVRRLPSTRVESIHPYHVDVRSEASGLLRLPNDFVFVLAGGVMPTEFLRSCGIEVVTKYGEA